MPPTSNTRRTSLHPPPPPPHDPSSSLLAPSATTKRTSSGRAIRSNANRPSNYYARTTSAQQAAVARDEDGTEGEGVGFFPAIQYFSDAVVALPREVMKQFTLVKEVEAKIYGPALELEGQLEGCLGLSVPTRGEREGGGEGRGGMGGGGGGMLSFTASNSIVGGTGSVSKDGSLLNGFGGGSMSILPSAAASVIGEDETATTDPAADEQLARRRQFLALRQSLHALLPNLDEKNVVLAEANRVLAQQLSRVDSVWPHVENEISEEARWGSMKHWAYSDNRAPRHKAGMVGAGAGRGYGRQGDVAATNSLVAAANMVHESEIAAARREAMRDGKVVKGKRAARDMVVEAGDSDFEEPRVVVKKAATKGVKKMAATAQGLGITGSNGEAVIKRRKVDKDLVAPGMERSNSSATAKGGKSAAAGLVGVGGREGGTPRSTPSATVTESNVAKKVAKTKPAAPPTKKRAPGSAHQSPAMASSPLHGSFGNAMEPPPPSTTLGRTGSTRLRQNSTTNLRHQSLAGQEGDSSRPVSSAGGKEKEKVGKTGTKRKARVDDSAEDSGAAVVESKRAERDGGVKREDSEMVDAGTVSGGVGGTVARPGTSRSSSGKNSSSKDLPDAQARARVRGQSLSKTSTPRADIGGATFAAPSLPPATTTRVGTGDGEATTPVIPGLARARSTRSRRNTGNLGESSASDEPKEQGVSGSGSGFGGIGGRRKGHGHERTASNSHILRQLMPFNRSPELKERGKSAEGEGEDGEDGEGEGDEDGAEVREGDIVEGGVEGQDGEGEGNDGQGEVGVDGKANRLKRVAELMKKSPGERVGRGGRVLSRPELMVAGRLEGSPSPVRDGELDEVDEVGDETEVGEAAQQEDGELRDGDEEMRDEDADIDEPAPEAASPEQEQNDALPSPSASPSPPPELEEADANALSSPSASPSPQPPSQQLSPELAPELDADIEGDVEGELEEDEDEDHDPDDPNEPKYCYCNRGSYGEMVACDNDQCEREWFHIGCTELLEAPGEDEGWWCDGCRPRGSGTGGGGRGGRGRGR
ncbi:hypothetical protein LTR97_001078 [Elasticomyces elasticus]|uniref:PHD-type domain-containing protein n=1 Tax=Elasticomyces elasticus TaxID=574655 RepID=A0AAN7WGT8_9PEZI|nr:hypothetical protein LTR97_001078 [Elasticomyces elasticus]